MTTAALRAPARWQDAVRAELRILASVRPLGWIVLFLLMVSAMGSSEAADGEGPFSVFRPMITLMFLLPLAWQGHGARERSAPLPIGDAARELVRVFCGAACAGAILGAGLVLYVVTFRNVDGEAPLALAVFPRKYPVALGVAGVAYYLFGAALALRSERPGRTLVSVFLLTLLALSAADIPLERAEFEVVHSWDGPRRYTGGTSLTLMDALFRLALGAAAVCASAWLGGLRVPEWPISVPRLARRRGDTGMAAPRPFATGIRAPVSLATVFRSHVRLLAPRMVLTVLMAAVFVQLLTPGELTAREDGRTLVLAEPLSLLYLVALLWPVLVWMDERRIHPWDEARPADVPTRRVLHAAAGLVWLQAVAAIMGAAYVSRAVEAGVIPSAAHVPAWLWLGLPLAVLAAYCLGTVPTVLSDRPILATVIFGIYMAPIAGAALNQLYELAGMQGPPAVFRLFAPFNWVLPAEWSAPSALVWTPLFAVSAAWAIRHYARREREQRPYPLPEKPAVRPNLWYGRRAGRAA